MSPKRNEYYPFKGGMNIVDPALSIPAGELIDGHNYECATRGGYRRIDGYERFDGHHLASTSKYYIMNFDAGEHEPQVGETVVGASSTASGVILEVNVTSGDWGTSDAAGYFVIHVEQGTFIDDEQLNIYHPDAFSLGFNSGFF